MARRNAADHAPGAMGSVTAPHLAAVKDQAVQLQAFDPGAVQVRKPVLAQAHEGGARAIHSRKTGQLRDSGRGKHRAGRRAAYL